MTSGFTASPNDPYSAFLSDVTLDQTRTMSTISELKGGPIPAVLDTSCVRTGLHDQLANGRLPASVDAVRSGQIRLFMELDTLNETWKRLPRFAEQLDVPLATLQGMFANDWLPLLSIVSIPEFLRQIDGRAMAVRDLDFDDYPAAALAALLSPCIVLTHDYHHFRPMGFGVRDQGVDAVFATINIKVGETHIQAIVLIPVTPVIAVGATTKWAADKVGPMAWVVLVILVVGGVVLYQRQPPERKERIKEVAAGAGKVLLDDFARTTNSVNEAHNQLSACVVPGPGERSVASAVVRKLAMSNDSMSAQQLCEVLDESVSPAVEPLRRFLHANKTTVFREVRRGGFVLGARYYVQQPVQG